MVTGIASKKKSFVSLIINMLDSYFGVDKRFETFQSEAVANSTAPSTDADGVEDAQASRRLREEIFWYGCGCC